MKSKYLYSAIATLTVVLAAQTSSAATNVWSGASGTDLLWSTPANWSPSGPPLPGDDAQFFDPGGALDLSTPNNIVAQSRTIRSLWFGQTNGFHYTLINPGMTLTLSGTETNNVLVAGTETDDGVIGESSAISGPGATLVLNNTNSDFIVRQESGSGGSALRSTLDLSGLDNLSADVRRVLVGVEGPFPRPAGTLYLAKTNVITAVGNAPALAIGGNGGGNHNSGNSSYVLLGQQNAINADSITVGRVKQTGNSSITFNTALFTDSVAVFRGADGVSRVSDWRLGDAESGSGSGNTAGICDFTGGTVDALVDSMILGRQVQNHNPVGTLTFDKGTFDVNTLTLGLQTSSSANYASGVVNVNGTGTLIVNSNLVFGQVVGGTGAPATLGTLNIGGGTVDVRGALTIGALARMNVTNGFLNLPTNSTLSLNTLTVDGGTISNATTIIATNQSLASLTIVNGGKLPNAVSFDLGTGGNAQWFPGDSLVFSNSLQGSGYIYSDVTQANGATLSPGGIGVAGTLFISAYNTPGNLTLNGGTLKYDLASSVFGVNDNVQVGGTLTLNSTNAVIVNAIEGGLDTTTPYTLFTAAAVVGNASGFHVAGPLSQSRYTFSFSATPNALQLSVGGAEAATLLWKGDGSANIWDLKSTSDWLNGATANQFFNLDNTIFDDSGSATPSINLVGSLVPGGITMSNLNKSYTFAGAGNFAGGNFTNFSTSTVTISNDNTNALNFVDLETGMLVLGGNSANNLSSVLINTPATLRIANSNANTFHNGINLNGGTLTFDQSQDATFDGAIANFGTVTKVNTNTLTMLGNSSSLLSPIIVNSGTIKSVAGSAALGTAGLTINSGGALDINSQNLSSVPVTAIGSGPDGSGAIVNLGVDQTTALRSVTLAGNTTFGGTARWDIRGSSPSLSTSGNNYNITKVGTNQVALVGVAVDSMLGDVDIQEGIFGIQTSTVSASGGFGDATKTITVHSGAQLETWGLGASTPLPKQIVLQDGATVANDSGVTVISGNVSMLGNALFIAGGTSLSFSAPISGSGSVIKGGSAILEFAGTNNYTGATSVTNGTLEIDGISAGSGVTVDGGTLAGIGVIQAPVTINALGTLSPGTNGIGALSVAGNVTLAGTTSLDLDKTAGVLSNDVLTNVTTLALGGSLQLQLTGDPLAAGDSFNVFSAGSITGSFTSITPAPGAGLQWDTTQLGSGILKVATASPTGPSIGNISISAGQVVLNGTGGIATSNYYVLATTNLSLPVSSWTSLGTNTFDNSGNFSFTNTADPSVPLRFYLIQVP
jgi:autotransporter-associated beta strand protein